ncbi:MAG TPA: hypothetical protein VE172_20360 [Stackebrandtia sp.]|uniref:hypothetical protein n=1 Tax=Stackebrandtia sp. TaxID=2023065 RepID=UPI002D5FD696|nr:hypothetical protein [Stackebrandtia sp.]HZE41160.1 hypothetical protein [Stackebrandtia sp.]
MLQRIVGTAALATGICMAAAGIASAASPVSGLADNPLGAVGSVDSVTGGSPLSGLGTDDPAGLVPPPAALTGKVGALTHDLPASKTVGKVTKKSSAVSSATDLAGLGGKTEALPLAGGLPVAGGLAQGLPTQGLPLVGDGAGQLPLVGGMTGGGQPAAPAKTHTKADTGKKTEFGDQMAATSVGGSHFAALPGDIAQRPAEDLPLIGGLPLVGGLTNNVPLGQTPLTNNQPKGGN